MLNLKVWTWTLACWTGFTYLLCVLWALVAPAPLHTELMALSLPGFAMTPIGILIGLAESLVYGTYAGALLAALHNLFHRRWGEVAQHPVRHA